MREIGARRTSVVEMLRDLADRVEKAEAEPTGCFVQWFCETGQVYRFRDVAPGFDLLRAAGIFESIKADVVDEIRGD